MPLSSGSSSSSSSSRGHGVYNYNYNGVGVASTDPSDYRRDDWGWLYFAPVLVIQLIFAAAIIRSRTIRFQQLLLCLSGGYWCMVVYYVQYFQPMTKTLFCDTRLTSCSYCLHQRISYLPEFFGLAEKQSRVNRSIADTNLLYFVSHVLYPVLQKLPVIGFYMTHLGFLISLVVAVGCVYLTRQTFLEVNDVCVINLILCIINWGLARSMWLHLHHTIWEKKAVSEKGKAMKSE